MRESGARKARMSEGWGVKEIEGNWKIGEGGSKEIVWESNKSMFTDKLNIESEFIIHRIDLSYNSQIGCMLPPPGDIPPPSLGMIPHPSSVYLFCILKIQSYFPKLFLFIYLFIYLFIFTKLIE